MVRDFKYIIKRVIIGVLIALILSFISGVAKADEVKDGQISPTMARLRQTGANIDSNFTNNLAHIGLSGNDTKTNHTLSIFFNTLSYYGYKGYRYKFSGYLNSYNNAYSTITAVDIANGNGEIIGVCEYQANGNQSNYQSFTLDCTIPNGLSNGSYANIMDFQFSTTGNTPQNTTSFDIYISSKMAVYKLSDSNTEIANNVNNINNSINSDSVDTGNANDTFNNLNNNMPTNSVISDLLLMPINFINKVLDGANNSCTTYHVGELWGDSFDLPCINGADYVGGTLWNVIDCIGAGMLAFMIGKRMVRIFNDLTNLKDGGLDAAYD